MKPLFAAIGILMLSVASPVTAQDEAPMLTQAAARAAILGCMAEVEAEGAAMTAESTDVDWAALRTSDDCIGVAADPCQKANNDTTYAMLECLGGEAEAWDALMGEWLAIALTDATAERRQVLEESQALWRSAMERSIDIYSVQYAEMGGGTIWGVLAVHHYNQMTARRALWIHGVANSL